MLQRKLFLFITIFLTLAALSVSVFFTNESYKIYVWPYILILLGYTFFRHMFFVLGAFLEDRKIYLKETTHTKNKESYTPRVSVIMPAYNEETVIAQSIAHLTTIRYPNLEILIIDDGSHDSTYLTALTAAAQYPHIDIHVFTKKNGGKSQALNYGIYRASGSLVLCVDADSRLHPDSLINGVQHFKKDSIGAVAGYVEIENPRNLLEEFQQLEYMVSLNFNRKAYSLLGIVPVVPGPVGLFRKDALDSVKGLTEDRNIFAEDAELSLRLISKGWEICSEEKMIAYTEAPDNIVSFLRQRYRWNRGTFQALAQNFMPLMKSKSHLSRFLAIHLYVEVWALPVINIALIYNFIIRMLVHGEIHFFTVWIAFGIFLDFWILVTAALRRKRLRWAMATFTLSKFSYEYVLFFWKMFCLLDEWREQKMSWDKIERTNNLSEVTHG